MPEVEVTYAGLIRTAVPSPGERLDLPAGATLRELLAEIVRRHGPRSRDFLFDPDGNLLPQAAIVVDGVGVRGMDAAIGGSVRIVVMSPMMAGG